jgi:hypothetical protein
MFKIIIVSTLIATSAYADMTKEYASTINVAGRQRMLSQKMMKELVLIKLGVNVDENKSSIAETITLFESSMQDLVRGNGPKSILPPSAKVESSLKDAQGLATRLIGDINKALKGDPMNYTEINEQAIVVLNAMNKIVENYVDIARSQGIKSIGGQVVNVAGRQRMLTQRVSKALFLMALGGDTSLVKHELKQAKMLFTQSHNALLNGNALMEIPKTTQPEIIAKLREVDALWDTYSVILDDSIKLEKVTSEKVKEAAELNPKILRLMNEAVTLYEKFSDESVKQAAK